MISGVGTDIVAIARIKELLGKHPERFVDRLLNDDEKNVAAQHKNAEKYAEHIAGRFAAKEAIAKALGTGIGDRLSFHDITIIREESGAPKVKLAQYANPVHLSISHEQEYAVAFAIAETIEPHI